MTLYDSSVLTDYLAGDSTAVQCVESRLNARGVADDDFDVPALADVVDIDRL